MKKLFILLLCWCFFYVAKAQEDDTPETNSENEEQVPRNLDHKQFLRLKRNYMLGDGLTLQSTNVRLNFTQSFQVQYGMNTLDGFKNTSTQFNIRRARFNFRGFLLNDKLYFRLRLNLAGNFQSATTGTRSFNNTLQDALIEYRPVPNHRFNFGVRADYADTREARIEGESLGFIDRSAVSTAFDPIFDYGIRYYGTIRLGGSNILKPYVSVTTGDGTAALQKNYGGFKYGIRLDYLPFGTFSRGGEYYMDDIAGERIPKLIMGVTFSYTDGISSAKGTNGGRFIYGDSAQNELLPNYLKAGFDFMFKYRGWYAFGEYVYAHAYLPSGIAGEFNLSGRFTPYTGQSPEQISNTVKSRINLGNGLNIQGGYCFGKWACAGRYSYLHADANAANFADQNRYYSVVATRFFRDHNLKLNIEGGFQEYKDNLKTADVKGNIYGQVMFTIQL
ncbi:MAG: hypothetical protein QM731_26130 [Chitinophagaceae bacterium]